MSCRDALDIKCFSEEVEFCGKCVRWGREDMKGLCKLTNEGTGFLWKCEHFSEDLLRCSVFDKECLYFVLPNYCGKTKVYLGLDLKLGLMVDTDALKKICSLPPT